MLSSTYDILLCVFFWSCILRTRLISNVLKDFIDFHVGFYMDFSVYVDLKLHAEALELLCQSHLRTA